MCNVPALPLLLRAPSPAPSSPCVFRQAGPFYRTRNGAAPHPQPRLSQAGSSHAALRAVFLRAFTECSRGSSQVHGSFHMGSILALHPHPLTSPCGPCGKGESPESHRDTGPVHVAQETMLRAPAPGLRGGRVSEAARGPGQRGREARGSGKDISHRSLASKDSCQSRCKPI